MEPRFCFTLDTEPDDLWARRSSLTFEHFSALPHFHRRMVQAGARPTYLTTSEVVEAPVGRRALEQFLAEGHCEVGAHFHTWTRKWPFEVPDLGQPPLHAMAHKLGQSTEERMLEYTCRALRQTLGLGEIRSYRGGRWSLGPLSARSLANCGIEVDSTVTPGITWRARQALLDGPDYRHAPRGPFWLGSEGGEKLRVLELPVGAAWFPLWSRRLYDGNIQRRVLTRLSRATGIRFGHRWLRPTVTSIKDMRATMLALRRAAVPIWVFMIHSSEIIPCKPLPTQAGVEAFKRRCIGAIEAAIQLGAKPSTLTEAGDWIRTSGQQLPSLPAVFRA
jgi:hypothetical protein